MERHPTLTYALITAGFALSLLGACRITDHTETDGVTSETLNFPASGYEDIDLADFPAFTFDSTTKDMGRVIQGAKVNKQFTFENTGRSALVITDVRGSCGCTVAKDWPHNPIAPGEKGVIEVSFDSEGRSGKQTKTVTVVANTNPASTVLVLSGEVVGPANMEPSME